MFSSPAVAGNLLFVGSCSGNFLALDKNTGEVKWSYDIKQDGNQTSFHGEMLITDELVIIGTDGGNVPTGIGHVYAFERETGKVRWKHFAGRGVTSDVLRHGSKVYAVTLTDELLCLDLESGELNWKFASEFSGFNDDLSHSPVVAGHRVFFGGLDGRVVALHAESGEVLWKTELDGLPSTSLIVKEDQIYVGTTDEHLYGLNAVTGAILSDFPTVSVVRGKPALVDSLLLYFSSRNGRLGLSQNFVGLDLASNTVRWRRNVAEETGSGAQPVVQIDAGSEAEVCAAEVVWSTPFPHVRGSHVLVGTGAGHVFAYRIDDGKRVWSHRLQGSIRSFGESGDLLYVGTVEGMIYALRLNPN